MKRKKSLEEKIKITITVTFLGYRSYWLITVTVLEKVTVIVAITVTVSLRDYKVAYASFQAGLVLACLPGMCGALSDIQSMSELK